MNNIDRIINSIKLVFDTNEDKVSSLVDMLNNIDANHIYQRFESVSKQDLYIYQKNDITSKVNLLNALMSIVLENPTMEEIEGSERKLILCDLYRASASLYEQLFVISKNDLIENLSHLVMYCMLSYLADEQTISHKTIEEYNKNMINIKDEVSNMDFIKQLEFHTYYLIVLMLSNVKNYDGLLNLDLHLKNTENLLQRTQEYELEKEELDIENGLKIGAFGNLIYLTRLLKEYLFDGKIIQEENQDIYTLIDMYSYNTFHLLENEDIELKLIGYLLKYSYEQVAQNSIWNIAEKSPKIRKFIEDNLSGDGAYIYSLLPSQRDVISEVLVPKKSIIVNMPTSSGKSLLAEMHILFSLHNYRTSDFQPTVCYIVPTNALMHQVKRDLSEDFKEFNFNIETTLPFYDIDEIEEEILSKEHIDILISTPEKLESLIRKGHPSILDTRLVIMDEAHNISSSSRGSKFELVLSSIKQKIKEANFLLLSPFISNADEIGEWLGGSTRNSSTISLEWTPTRQYIGCNILSKGKTKSTLEFYQSTRNYLGSENIEILLSTNPQEMKLDMGEKSINDAVKLSILLNDFIDQDGNILVLCPGLGTTKTLSDKITRYFVSRKQLTDISLEPEVSKALEIIRLETGDNSSLLECVKYGVAYHHSGLSNLVKETIEELIRKNHIKLIFATTTLAQGMNFPINTIIFATLKFRGKNSRYFTNAEFWNIAGRAGRAYKDKEGYIITPFTNSQKATRKNVKRFIKADLEQVISSLNYFFAGDTQINFDYNFLKEKNNLPILNLIQYINHILKIGYDYNIKPSDMAKIRTILNDSFLYHSLSRKEGYINAQRRLNTFVTEYIGHINQKKKQDLEKADQLGISDISYSKVKSMVGGFIMDLKNKGDNEYKASKIILETRDINRMSRIIEIISRIPEINIEMRQQGEFDPQSIATILLGWVNGQSIENIASRIKRENQSLETTMELCNRYLNSQMKSYMPWGINIYQELSYDIETDDAKMLPSFIYYGVSSKEAVIVSKIGVPRFASDNVLQILRSDYPEVEINVGNIEIIKSKIKNINPNKYKIKNVSGKVIKEIVDSKIE